MTRDYSRRIQTANKLLLYRRRRDGSPHQRGFTQQFAPSDQVSDGDVEIRVPAAPVGDLGERMSGEDVLQGETAGCQRPFHWSWAR